MSHPQSQNKQLSDEEWKELVALKEAITYAPQTVSAHKMEKFTELLVRSWNVPCDPVDNKEVISSGAK